MHTSLALLKDVKACIPGYTKMVAFFTTRPEMKDVKIPLSMVAMVAGSDDCEWAADNGFVLDPKEFEAVYRENLWRVLRHQFWRHITDSDYNGDSRANEVTKTACAEIEVMHTHEQAVAFLEKHRTNPYSGDLWNVVLAQPALNTPFHFVRTLISNYGCNYTHAHRVWRLEHGLITEEQKATATNRSSDDDEDEDDSYRDRRRREENRRDRLLRKDDMKFYYDVRKREPRQYSLARALWGNADPFVKAMQFVHEYDLPSLMGIKGLMLSQASDKEPPAFHMSLNLSDAEMMFRVLHLVKATDFDINKLVNMSDVSDAAVVALQRQGVVAHSQGLDHLQASEVVLEVART
jgi:hypothetical protein